MKANYQIVSDRPGEPLLIRDIGPWDRFGTVTNAAEEVVAELVERGLLPPGRRLLYYDSSEVVDEILIQDGRFAGFKPFATMEDRG